MSKFIADQLKTITSFAGRLEAAESELSTVLGVNNFTVVDLFHKLAIP